MHIAKGFFRPNVRVSAGLAPANLTNGAWIFFAILLAVSSAWFQGCVPTEQTQRESSPSPTEASPPGGESTEHRAQTPGDSSRISGPTRGVQADKNDREQTGLPPIAAPHATGTTSERKRDRIGVKMKKLNGYQVPAEYLFIPSQHYPEATVAVMLPTGYDQDPNKKYPLIIAFGGAGECAKSPEQGALAWLRYYKTDEAARAAERGTLSRSDFRGLVTDKQLKDFNRSLKQRPYHGVILACPSSPPLWGLRTGVDFPEYEAFVMKELVPELQKRYRTDPDKVGIDGVSMGGARALYYGLKYPAVFSSIGAVQGAFGPYVATYRELIEDNKEILGHRSIQLVTSDGDAMLRSVEHMHKVLRDANIPHRYEVLTGPHDYIFNQGPGALSLLLFHNHALAGAVGPVE